MISLCGAHLMHQFSGVLKGKGLKKETRPGYMWLFAKMQQATTLAQLGSLFETVCLLALSKQQRQPISLPTEKEETPGDGKQTEKTKVEDAQDVTSAYYCPSLAEYLVGTVMLLAPLWCQFLTQQTASNAAVEAHMRVVKKTAP